MSKNRQEELAEIIENHIEIWGEGGCDVKGCAQAILSSGYIHKDDVEVSGDRLWEIFLEYIGKNSVKQSPTPSPLTNRG